MNRRQFIQSLAAAAALPAAPALSFTPSVAVPSATAASAMATKARFWAIYMHGIQGNCTPATLSTVLNIPEAEARNYVTRFIADGVIKPNPLLKKASAKVAKVVEKKMWRTDEGILEQVEEYVGWQWEDEGGSI